MANFAVPEIKQPKKRGRPRKNAEGVEASQYFKTLVLTTVAKTNPDPCSARSIDRSMESEKQKIKRYRMTSALKGFATNCTAFPVEWWEAIRVDRHSHCGLCGEVFEGMDLLRDHIQEHLFLKCLLCSSSFNRLESFKSHMQQHPSTLFKGDTLPCSSAVLNKTIDGESNSDQNKTSAGEFTYVQNKGEIVGESSRVQNEKMDYKSSAVPEGNPSDITRVGRSMPEIDFQEDELIIGQLYSSFDGQALNGAKSQLRTDDTVENRGSDGSHCSIPHIIPLVPTSGKPFVCSISNVQSRSVATLCKHNRLYHNLDSCRCQNGCSNDNVENGTNDQGTVTFEKLSLLSEASDPRIESGNISDHASYCIPDTDVPNRVLEIIDIDSEAVHPIPNRQLINSNIETIICDNNMPHPLIHIEFGSKSMRDEVGIGGNQISSRSYATVGKGPGETLRFPPLVNPNMSETISLLDDCEDDDVCVQEDPNSKNQEVKRSSEANRKSNVTETGSEPYPLIPVKFGSKFVSDKIGIRGNQISSESSATVRNGPTGTPRYPAPIDHVCETTSLLHDEDDHGGVSKTVMLDDCEDDDVLVVEDCPKPKSQEVKSSSGADKKCKATKTDSGLSFDEPSAKERCEDDDVVVVEDCPKPKSQEVKRSSGADTKCKATKTDSGPSLDEPSAKERCEDDDVVEVEDCPKPKSQEVKRSSGADKKCKATKTDSGPSLDEPSAKERCEDDDVVEVEDCPKPKSQEVKRSSGADKKCRATKTDSGPSLDEPSVKERCEDDDVVEVEDCPKPKSQEVKRSSGADTKCKATKTVSGPSLDEPSAKERREDDDVVEVEDCPKPKSQEVNRSSGADTKCKATKTDYGLSFDEPSAKERCEDDDVVVVEDCLKPKSQEVKRSSGADKKCNSTKTDSGLSYDEPSAKERREDDDVVEVEDCPKPKSQEVNRSSGADTKCKATKTDYGLSFDEPSAKERCEDDDVVVVEDCLKPKSQEVKRSSGADKKCNSTKTDSGLSYDEPSAKERREDDDVVEVEVCPKPKSQEEKRSSGADTKCKATKTDSGSSLDELSAKERCEDDDVVEVEDSPKPKIQEVKRSSGADKKCKATKTDSGPCLDELSAKERCEDDNVVEVEDCPKFKSLEGKMSSEADTKCKATKTDSGPSLDEPSAKKRCEDDDVVEVQCRSESKNQEVKRSSRAGQKSKATKTDSTPSLDEPSAKKRKNNANCKKSAIENNSRSHKSKSKALQGRVSRYELHSLFSDIPKPFVDTGKTSPSAIKRVTRHSVSSNERADSCITVQGIAKKRNVAKSNKKSNRNNSSKVNFLTRLYIAKDNNEPKVADIKIKMLDGQTDELNKKSPKVPRTVISDKNLRSFSWIVDATSKTAKSRANDRKWKKLLKDTRTSESSLQIGISEAKNEDNHWPESVADDEDVSYNTKKTSKTLPGADELESGILAALSNFEVVDVRSFDESTGESHENEADESSTCKDPLALNFEDAQEHDNVFGVHGTSDDLPIVLQPSDAKVNFDYDKFLSRIPTTTAIRMEDVPELVEGQWLVHHFVQHRFDRLVEKVLAFSNKRSYINGFESEDPHENIPKHKIVEEYTYFCDYRKGNHATTPVKFKHLYRKLIGGSNTKISRSFNCRNDSMKLSTVANVPLTKLEIGPTNLTCHGNGVQKNVEGNTTRNQENSLPVELEHDTMNTSVGDNNGILESCENYATRKENDACSVELENYTSNERWMELMNLEMESDDKLKDIEGNNIKTKDIASLEELDNVIHDEELMLDTEENAATNDTMDDRKSPVLINGKMKILSPDRSDLEIGSIPALHQTSSNSELSKESLNKSSTHDEQSGYWGFSDPETDEEDMIAVATPKLVNETIEAKSIVADIHGIFEISDDETGVSKNSGQGQDSWDQLNKVLKKIDEVPTPNENLSCNSIKPLSKKTASLPVHKDFDSSSGSPAEPSIEGNIGNTFHLQRQLNSHTLHNKAIFESKMKERGMFHPIVPDENQQKISSIQNHGPHPSCSSVSKDFDLSAGITDEHFMKNEGRIRSTCHSRRELNAHVQHHRPVRKSEPRDRVTACPYQKQVKKSEVSSSSKSDSQFYVQETNNIERLYDSLQTKRDRAESATEDEDDFTTVDILDHMDCCSSYNQSDSSGSSSPDYVDDVILQAEQSRRGSQCTAWDPREFRDCMSPPMYHGPPSSVSSESMDDFGTPRSVSFSPPPPRRTLRTHHYFKKERFDSSPSLSPASDRSMESSEVSGSPTFIDWYDSD